MYNQNGEIEIDSGSPNIKAKIVWSSIGDPSSNTSSVRASLVLTLVEEVDEQYTLEQLEDLIYEYYSMEPSDYEWEGWEIYEDTVIYWLYEIFDGSLWNPADPTQSQLEQSINEIISARDNLVAIQADTYNLEELVNLVYSLNESNYTPESWLIVSYELENAEYILNEEFPLQSEVDRAYDYLYYSLINELIPNDFDNLYEYSFVETSTPTVYSGVSVNGFNDSYVQSELMGFYPRNIIIPDTVNINGDSYEVVMIGKEAFSGNIEDYESSLLTVTIPWTVAVIDDGAFKDNLTLNTLIIEGSNIRLDTIGKYSFANTDFYYFAFGSPVRVIDDYAFYNVYLFDIAIGPTVDYIGEKALGYIYDEWGDEEGYMGDSLYVYADEIGDDEWPILRGYNFSPYEEDSPTLFPYDDWPY